jgi:PilZ domain
MPPKQNGPLKLDTDAEELISEIEQNTPDAVKSERVHARHSVRAKVTVDPASMSHRRDSAIDGITGDVSAGGALILTNRPLCVNDVYLVSFDQLLLDIPPVYALCLRVRMVRSDAFEAGLKFIAPIRLPTPSHKAHDSLV